MEIDFEKMGGLVPAIIQDAVTKNVLILGFMNKEAYEKTIATKKVIGHLPQPCQHSERLRQRHAARQGTSTGSNLP